MFSQQNGNVSWQRRAQIKQLAAERQIKHRKSCLVLSARFPVANWRSRPFARSAYYQRKPELSRMWCGYIIFFFFCNWEKVLCLLGLHSCSFCFLFGARSFGCQFSKTPQVIRIWGRFLGEGEGERGCIMLLVKFSYSGFDGDSQIIVLSHK